MTSKQSVSLANFFVFNSKFCRQENDEHSKILYFSPTEIDLNTRVRSVGLCEAVIKFTETFGTSACDALHTQKTKQVFLQPEPDYWMVMTLNIPCQEKTRDGQTIMEYFTDDIQDHVYQSLLLKAYRMFTLLNGTFVSILGDRPENVSLLRKKLDEFFENYLMNIKSSDADLLDIFQGIHFLPLERYSFLKIICFINQVQEKFSCVKFSIFLYNDQLVWSGLDPNDTQILYQHLSSNLIPSFIESELKGGVAKVKSGRFMTSTADVFLKKGRYSLLVYRAWNATLCLLVEENLMPETELFQQLDRELGSQLSDLASNIGEQYAKTVPLCDPSVMYMYFNHLNLAEKTTMHDDKRRSLVPGDCIKFFTDFHTDLVQMGDCGEIIAKTTSDWWVVGKSSDQRELYVILQQKNSNIMDVNEELKKLSASTFQGIFILD